MTGESKCLALFFPHAVPLFFQLRPRGGQLTADNLHTECAYILNKICIFFPQTFQASDRQRLTAVGQNSPVRKGEDLQTGDHNNMSV